MRPVDRAPQVTNRPSSSPIHLMTRPDSKKLSMTTGEHARQFSSFSPDGLFPQTLNANKAARGNNEIDKELQAEQRKAERAQFAAIRDGEHHELEEELNRIIRLPLVDFLKIPPTTDPQQLLLSSSRSSTVHGGLPARAAASSPALLDAEPSAIGLTSASGVMRPSSSASQRPASAASSFFGGAAPSVASSCVPLVPNTTFGSRPTTPSVYIGGRVNIDCTATLSRPSSAALTSAHTAVPTNSPTAASTAVTAAAPLPLSRSMRQSSRASIRAPCDTVAVSSNAPAATHHHAGGHLLLLVHGVAVKAASHPAAEAPRAEDIISIDDGTFHATESRPGTADASHASLSAPRCASPPKLQHNCSVSDTSQLMSTSPFAHLLQRRPVCSAAGGPARALHQRHQTQARKQFGFNISTSSVSHTPDDAVFDLELNTMLRSRPSSAAVSVGPDLERRHVNKSLAKLIERGQTPTFPLRSVFLQ